MSTQATPEARALDRLLGAYRLEHGRYRRTREEIRFWRGGLLVTAIAAPLVLGVLYLLEGSRIVSEESAVVLGVSVAVPFGRLTWLAYATRRSRRELRRLKLEIDSVGYHVACDTSSPVERRLRLQEEEPTGENIIGFEQFKDLDFDSYDRAFRL